MFRRFITTLVLLGFNVSQLAAPHAHGAASLEEQRQHDEHPHVHFWFGGEPHDGHDGNRDESSTNQSRQAADGLADEPLGDEHDADAIYLPGAGAPASGNDRSHSPTQGDNAFAAQFTLLPTCVADDESTTPIPWRPPDEHSPACPTFLKLRTIRI